MEGQELKPIKCKAAICYEPKKPLKVEEIWVAPPNQGEVRIKVISNALCHTDVYTLDGHDPEGNFPCILGHEATGVVESIGKGVKRVKVGDIVIPCYNPQCREKSCIFCQHERCNLCPKIRSTQGKGVMPDGTSRFTTLDNKPIHHFMGCSTFSEYTVISQISAAKINPNADLNKVCMIGCGVATGWGAVMNNTNVKPGQTVAVWGLGAVGLAVIQASKIRGAKKIYAIDTNPKKFEAAKKFGADVCYQPTKQKDAKSYLNEKEKWGIECTFDCTGNVEVMRQALEAAHRGWGQSCVIGVAEAGKEIATRPFQLVTGRRWLGSAFGGWKSADDVPKLVNKSTLGEWPLGDYVTHQFDGIEKVNESIDALHSGDCLRAVVKISAPPEPEHKHKIKVTSTAKLFNGSLQTVSHWSESTNGFMTFNIYIPDIEIHNQRCSPYPALYCLGGLEGNHTSWSQKSGFGAYARKHKIAVVFPDTSPRNTNIQGVSDDSEVGDSASFYVDATSQKYKQHFQMFTYITEELPRVVATYFPVSQDNMSITGFSMGGHGALICGLKSNKYKSISALAPIGNPTVCDKWGKKAYKEYFTNPEQQGEQWDATCLIKSGKYTQVPLLIDVGTSDQFSHLLNIQDLKEALNKADWDYKFLTRPGYNHSFNYVATVAEQHFDFHATYLNRI